MTEGNPDRTKLSVIVFLLLTFGLSSIFYWRIIHQAAPGMQRGHNFDVLYLMWSPGVSGLLHEALEPHELLDACSFCPPRSLSHLPAPLR